MKHKNRSVLWGLLYAAALTGFTLYALLDTFVIPRAYTAVVSSAVTASSTPTAISAAVSQSVCENPSETETPAASSQTVTTSADTTVSEAVSSAPTAVSQAETVTEPVITDTSYTDENIQITITEYREYDTDIYVADIRVSDAQYLKTALAGSTYGRNITEKTSTVADEYDAILAINGDYYGARSRGYVIRNGVLYRSSSSSSAQEDLAIFDDGSFRIVTEGAITAEGLLSEGAMQVLSFGPALIKNGAVAVTAADEVDKSMTSNPRTAIGIIDELHYVMVVSDGRTTRSEGLTLYQMAQFLQKLGVQTAYNLDGGGSSTMVFNGVVVNNPTTNGKTIKERSVSDIVYIGY